MFRVCFVWVVKTVALRCVGRCQGWAEARPRDVSVFSHMTANLHSAHKFQKLFRLNLQNFLKLVVFLGSKIARVVWV